MSETTNETQLLEGQIERLEVLHATPRLKLSASGGGIEEEQTLFLDNGLLISRLEIFCVLNRLRAALATRRQMESPAPTGPTE